MSNLTVQAPYNPNRPTDPRKPNGIAHAESNDTKADRKAAKLAWADYVEEYKSGETSAAFPTGTVIYPNDTSQPPVGNAVKIMFTGALDAIGQGTGGQNSLHLTIPSNQRAAVIAASAWKVYVSDNSQNTYSITYTGNDGNGVFYFDMGTHTTFQTDTFWYIP